jgi:hypothetical protein
MVALAIEAKKVSIGRCILDRAVNARLGGALIFDLPGHADDRTETCALVRCVGLN